MTIKELYEWAVDNHAEDLDLEVQYRDGGGIYYGTDSELTPIIACNENDLLVVII